MEKASVGAGSSGPSRAASAFWSAADIITPGCVLPSLGAGSKTVALSLLARQAAVLVGFDPMVVYRALDARERLGSTGVGGGVAIPHARLSGLGRPTIVFARLEHPIDFEAVDDQPVDLLFLLLSPDHDPALHLKALSRIARVLHDPALCRTLRRAESRESLCDTLVGAFSV